MSEFFLRNILITSTGPSDIQTILYNGLTDYKGIALPATFSSSPLPVVTDLGGNVSGKIHFPSTPTTTSFTIAKSTPILVGATYLWTLGIVAGTVSAPVGRNLDTLLTILGMLLGDVKGEVFTPTMRVDLLNMAQDSMITYFLSERMYDHLRNLEVVLTDASDLSLNSDGEFDLLGLDQEIFADDDTGILNIKYGGFPVFKISDFEKTEDEKNISKNFTFSASQPIYRVDGHSLVIEPFDSDTTNLEKFKYIRKPTLMVLGDTVAENINCEFNRIKQKIIL